MTDFDSITQKINTLVKTPEPAGSMFSSLDQQRDLTVKKLSNDYNNQTTVMTVNKQVKDVVGFFKKAFGVSKNVVTQNKSEIAQLQTKITTSQSLVDQLGLTAPVIQQLVALVVLGLGLYYIISGTPNNGQSDIVTSIFAAITAFFSSLASRL